MLTPEDLVALWSAPKAPQFHAGTKGLEYDNLHLFNAALFARHGAATSLEDYVKKAQLMNYEGERAEYEAYSRNKYHTATGVVHWMLNNGWPSLIWHLYGHDLAPAAGYFGAKKANEPAPHSILVRRSFGRRGEPGAGGEEGAAGAGPRLRA